MSIRSVPGRSLPGYPRSAERIQREHELATALDAVRHAQARLELLGDRRADVEAMRLLRDSLARDLDALDVMEKGPPFQRFREDPCFKTDDEPSGSR